MNYMKRNVFSKKNALPVKTHIKPNTKFDKNYEEMMSNFLSLSPSENVPAQGVTCAGPSMDKEVPGSKSKLKHQKSCAFDTTSRLNTIISDDDFSVIMALSEGRGHAQCEVGIAAININSPNLILCQLSDNIWYTGTLTKLNILNAVEILVPNTYITANGQSKLVKFIQTMYPKIKISPIPRRHFNETVGLELIEKLSAISHQNIKLQVAEKFYTLASVAALLNYIEFIKFMKFLPNTLQIEYQPKYGSMLIDVETSHHLELLYPLCKEKAPKATLFGIINYCVTAIGKRSLRAKILQPSCDIPTIISSHQCIRELLDKDEILFNLNNILKRFCRVDKLLKLAVFVPQEDNIKAAEIMIDRALFLKTCLEDIPSLYDVLTETECHVFKKIWESLRDPRYQYLLETINSILSKSSGHGSGQYFQRLYAVKPNINKLLDASRQMYSDKVDRISKIIKEHSEIEKLPLRMIHTLGRGFHIQLTIMKHQSLPNLSGTFEILSRNGYNTFITTEELKKINIEIKELVDTIQITSNVVVSKLLTDIRQEIDAIYHLTGFITELDIIQSLTTASKIGNYCQPKISESIKITKGRHPLLAHNIDKTDCVPNNVIATPDYNFYVITGPNMGGKSIYLKMIAVLQVLFQVGCFIPAELAEFRICDKLFSRIGLSDNLENGSSSFFVEMQEMEYIIKNITPNSLVIFDELCRSTNPDEGKFLAWKICEKLIKMNGVSNDGEYFKDGKNESTNLVESNAGIRRLLNTTSPFIFVATHFMELTKLDEQYYSIINLHLSAKPKTIDDIIHLEYLHKVDVGVTPVSQYGLALARNVKFPSDIIPRAEQILNESVSSNSTTNLDLNNTTFNCTTDSVKITTIERGLYNLWNNMGSVLRGGGEKEDKLNQINNLLDEFAGTQKTELLNLMQNKSFDEIFNATLKANSTVETANQTADDKQRTKPNNVSDVDATVGKTASTSETADLSYHSLKRRIAEIEEKKQKKLCTVKTCDHKPISPDVFASSKIKVGVETKQLTLSLESFLIRKTIKQTTYTQIVRPVSQTVEPERKSYLKKSQTKSMPHDDYQSDSKFVLHNHSSDPQSTNRSNLSGNNKVRFLHNERQIAQSMFNKRITEKRIGSDSDQEDDDIPDICTLTPAVKPDWDYAMNSSQVVSIASSDDGPLLDSDSFYNVSEFGDSQEASKNSLKQEVGFRTELFLKSMYEDEMKKHSTYKTSKTKDNRIMKESPNSAYSQSACSVRLYKNNSNFFTDRPKQSPFSSTPEWKSQNILFGRHVGQKSKPLPTSTATLSDLKMANSGRELLTPMDMLMKARSMPTSSMTSNWNGSNCTPNQSLCHEMIQASRVESKLDKDKSSIAANDAKHLANQTILTFNKDMVDGNSNSSSSVFKNQNFLSRHLGKKFTAFPTSNVTLSDVKGKHFIRQLFTPTDMYMKSQSMETSCVPTPSPSLKFVDSLTNSANKVNFNVVKMSQPRNATSIIAGQDWTVENLADHTDSMYNHDTADDNFFLIPNSMNRTRFDFVPPTIIEESADISDVQMSSNDAGIVTGSKDFDCLNFDF